MTHPCAGPMRQRMTMVHYSTTTAQLWEVSYRLLTGLYSNFTDPAITDWSCWRERRCNRSCPSVDPFIYDTIRDAILTCARKPTWVSLIYRTEPTTKKCKNRKTKSRKQICSEITINSPGNPCSEYLRRRNEGLQREGFAEKEGFKPGVKEWVGRHQIIVSMTVGR